MGPPVRDRSQAGWIHEWKAGWIHECAIDPPIFSLSGSRAGNLLHANLSELYGG
jgi:hypothetical protein